MLIVEELRARRWVRIGRGRTVGTVLARVYGQSGHGFSREAGLPGHGVRLRSDAHGTHVEARLRWSEETSRDPGAVRLGRRGGSANTPAQDAARRANGQLGGRPRGTGHVHRARPALGAPDRCSCGAVRITRGEWREVSEDGR